jgi:hypothetical protein
MERLSIESSEMELRHNEDFMARLDMIGEGGPIYDQPEMLEKRREDSRVFEDAEKLPRDYQ